MTAHIHAALMAQYAQDALETDKPWERWEWRRDAGSHWETQGYNPGWYAEFEYRRKPKAISINGIEVPEPLREAPTVNSLYWLVNPLRLNGTENHRWDDTTSDRLWLQRGLIHSTREAAEAHARALLSFTTKEAA